jgi:hypothetical protein
VGSPEVAEDLAQAAQGLVGSALTLVDSGLDKGWPSPQERTCCTYSTTPDLVGMPSQVVGLVSSQVVGLVAFVVLLGLVGSLVPVVVAAGHRSIWHNGILRTQDCHQLESGKFVLFWPSICMDCHSQSHRADTESPSSARKRTNASDLGSAANCKWSIHEILRGA